LLPPPLSVVTAPFIAAVCLASRDRPLSRDERLVFSPEGMVDSETMALALREEAEERL